MSHKKEMTARDMASLGGQTRNKKYRKDQISAFIKAGQKRSEKKPGRPRKLDKES